MKVLKSRKNWMAGAVVILAGYFLVAGIIPGWNRIQSDFPNYYVSSKLLLESPNPIQYYDYAWFNEQIERFGIDQAGNFGPFPPISSTILVGLAPFSPLIAKRIWVILNLAFLFLVIYLVRRISGWRWLTCSVLVLSAGAALAANAKLGQVYLLILLFMLLTYVLERRNRNMAAGLILAAISVLKYYPLFMLLVYSRRKNRKIVLWTMVGIVFLVAAQLLLFYDATVHYYLTVFPGHLLGNLPHQGGFPIQFQSWSSLFNNLFVADPISNPIPWFDWPVGRTIGFAAVNLTVAGVTGILVWRLRRSKKAGNLEMEMGLIGISLMTVLPATGIYHFLLVLMSVLMLMKMNSRYLIPIAIAYLGLGFFPYGWFVETGWPLLLRYPRLWISNLIMVLAWLSVWDWTRNKPIIYNAIDPER